MAHSNEPPAPLSDARDTQATESLLHQEDLALVRSVVGGSHSAWTLLLNRYSGLIHAVIRRYLHSRDRDDLRNVYVDVIVSLHQQKLARYEGRAALSTWLTLVTRSAVQDFLRHRFGRRETPLAMRRLDPEAREVYRLYYVEGRSLGDVIKLMSAGPAAWTLARALETLQHIEDVLDSRWLKRIAYDLHAQSTGAASGRLCEYLDHVRDELAQRCDAGSADYHLMEREAQEMAARVLEHVRRLPEAERQMLSLRFQQGWSARRIADELGFPGPRGVHTVLERIVRRIRRMIRSQSEAEAE